MVIALAHPIVSINEHFVTIHDEGLRLELNISTRLGISAMQAKRKLSRFLMDEVSLLVGPEEPLLVLAGKKKILWRFPIELSMGKKGRLGQIGTIDIDAHSGDMLLNDELLMEIKTNARLLARGATLSADA